MARKMGTELEQEKGPHEKTVRKNLLHILNLKAEVRGKKHKMSQGK